MQLELYKLPRLNEPASGTWHIPLEFLDGTDAIAGVVETGGPPSFHFLIGGSTKDLTIAKHAEAETRTHSEKVAAAVNAQFIETAEFAAREKAGAELTIARNAMAEVQARVLAAKSKYDETLAAGDDPRACRGDCDIAGRELSDVQAWVAKRTENYNQAAKGAADKRARLWRDECGRQLAHLAGRREELRTRLREVAAEITSGLVLVHCLESAFQPAK